MADPIRPCSVSGCQKPHSGRGLCQMHLARMKRHGSLDLQRRKSKEIVPPDTGEIARFWARVDRSSGPNACWEWQAARQPTGYGAVWLGRRVAISHRVAWTLTNGPIPNGKHVCHHCDNPPCCNPEHLFLGTDDDNMRDKEQKGRANHSHSEARPSAKLTNDDVREIRRLLATGLMQREVADCYGVHDSQISRINSGHLWRHVI